MVKMSKMTVGEFTYMKERIEMLGGIVEFEGKNGFVVNAKIPIRWGKTYD